MRRDVTGGHKAIGIEPNRTLFGNVSGYPGEHGSRMAVVASLAAQVVRLVEELPSDGPPEEARLRVEVFDRHRGRTVASMRCDDLQEAEAATVTFLADAVRAGPTDEGGAAKSVDLSFRPVPVATGCADEAGFLVLADGRLAAVLVRLSDTLHGPELAGSWFLEAGFGPCRPDRQQPFATLDAAEAWLMAQLSGKGVSNAPGR